jgi:pimeloyl-ACP methyl ester carboxylesterase
VTLRFSQTAQRVSLNDGKSCLSVGHAYTQRADRPRVLLLHGNPADMDDWNALAAELAGRVELLAPDLPGFGHSDDVPTTGRKSALDMAADCMHAAAANSGWNEPYYVMGHSHGAGVAQTLAVRNPQSVAGLILVASLGVPVHAAYRQLALPGMSTLLRVPSALATLKSARPIMRSVLRGIMGPMFDPVPLPQELVEQQLEAFARRPSLFVHMALVARGKPCEQLAENAARIGAPVLFIHGTGDKLVPVAHARGIASLLPDAAFPTFETVKDAGHMIHVTHASAVAALVESWLERRARSNIRTPPSSGQLPVSS